MSTRGSSSVMATRKKGTAASLNFFPTPPWAVRALLYRVLCPWHETVDALSSRMGSAWEPACGAGHCALPLREAFHEVYATDVYDWGFGDVRNLDFSYCGPGDAPYGIDWVITNPPFTQADTFARRGLAIARHGVALLMRLQWLEGEDRYAQFFAQDAPYRVSVVVPFTERVPMIEGVWDPEASSATAYAWFVWFKRPQELWSAPANSIPMLHLPPGMEVKYTRPWDEALTSRGEALRRKQRPSADTDGVNY